MEVDAILCDALSIREKLLHVLGGGITRITRDVFPCPLGVDLGILITCEGEELGREHVLHVYLKERDTGDVVAEISGGFTVTSDEDDEVVAAFGLETRGIVVRAAGRYRIEVAMNGETRRRLPLRVLART